MEDILASIKRVIAEEKEFRETDAPAEDAEEHGEDVLELDATMVPHDGTGHEPSAPPAAEAVDDVTLMAEEVTTSARASLEELGSVAAADPVAASANPFEDMVREMLRPMLKQWLDERLPGIVDEHVRREISRITGRKL